MIKQISAILCVLTMIATGISQENKEFRIPKENKGHLTIKANKGETFEIQEDSAFILSTASFYAYRHLRNELLKYQALNNKNLEVIHGSLQEYIALLKELDQTIKSIDNLKEEQLAPIINNLEDVNNRLISDVNELKELNKTIEEKVKELEDIKKNLQWYRWKNAWFKFADWIVAGAVGFAIGAIAM